MGTTSYRRSGISTHLALYVLFGGLHEASHILAAYLTTPWSMSWIDLSRVILGRYTLIRGENVHESVLHIGWLFSTILAICLFLLRRRTKDDAWSIWVYIASVVALESITTDLLGWTPMFAFPAGCYVAWCGNFGLVLLNPMWINVDGGRTALEILEKMVEVTMMRGE